MYAIGLGILFAVGALVALTLLAVPIFLWSLIRGARAVHADGVVCRAEVVPIDAAIGPRLAGPAVVRLGGAFKNEGETGSDVLGMAVRFRRSAGPIASEADLADGDQDFLAGTFESFWTARKDQARTRVEDFLANEYSSVSVWRIDGAGPGKLRALPPSPAGSRTGSRIERLDADIAAGRAAFTLEARTNGTRVPVAELRLLERLPHRGRALRISMFRTGRGLRPTGFRNGIRAVVYPVSQLARRLRGA